MKNTRVYLLTGKLKWGHCGSSYVGSSYFRGRDKETKCFIYACNQCQRQNGECNNKAIRADLLENYVLDMIHNEILSNTAIGELSNIVLELGIQAINIKKVLKDDINKKKSSLKFQVDKSFVLYFEGDIDKEMLTAKTNKLKQ